MYQLRNLLGRTNVGIDPSKDFNSCEDFLCVVIKGLIVSAAIETFGLDSVDDCPPDDIVPPDAWLYANAERKDMLSSLTNQIISKFVNFKYNNFTMNQAKDLVLEYEVHLLNIGLFYLEYQDAIKEGDGERVLRCWKYLLPIFFNSNRTNYTKEALNLLYQQKYQLTERQAKQLLYSRFINTQGIKGRNIPCDLHMEHLNRMCKEIVKDLGSNKTITSIVNASKNLGTIDEVIRVFDNEGGLHFDTGIHKEASCINDVKVLTESLMKYKVFSQQTHRKAHLSFTKPKNLLHCKSQSNLLSYMEKNLSTMSCFT